MSAAVAPLPDQFQMLGSSVDLTCDEYLEVIRNHIDNHPRSQQVAIGPSEIGQACGHRIAYKLLGHPERTQDTPWLPTIGTALHTWLDEAFAADNQRWQAGCGVDRWITEQTVTVGTINQVPITGHCDLYDRVTGTVIDHKLVGPTQLRKYKTNGPGSQYRTQAHLYGRGFAALGLPVDQVMIAFLPRNSVTLDDAHLWHEPYDEQVALDGLSRVEGIGHAVTQLGVRALDVIGAVDDYCNHCAYLRAGSTDLSTGCPGVEMARVSAPALTLATTRTGEQS